jgi:hypothetical protein
MCAAMSTILRATIGCGKPCNGLVGGKQRIARIGAHGCFKRDRMREVVEQTSSISGVVGFAWGTPTRYGNMTAQMNIESKIFPPPADNFYKRWS